MPSVQNVSVWNNVVGSGLVLAWRSGSGRKGQNHHGRQEMLRAGGRGKWGGDEGEG